jgi:hypothetical protein
MTSEPRTVPARCRMAAISQKSELLRLCARIGYTPPGALQT